MKHLLVSYNSISVSDGKHYIDSKRVNTNLMEWDKLDIVEKYEHLLTILPKYSSIISITDLTKVLE